MYVRNKKGRNFCVSMATYIVFLLSNTKEYLLRISYMHQI